MYNPFKTKKVLKGYIVRYQITHIHTDFLKICQQVSLLF